MKVDLDSRQVLKTGLDMMDVLDLDLDWSRLSRPPGLLSRYFLFLYKTVKMAHWKGNSQNKLYFEAPNFA